MSATAPSPRGSGHPPKAPTTTEAARGSRRTATATATPDAWRLSGGDGSLGQYLAEIQRYPLVPREEEPLLAERIAAGDEAAFRRLVEGNLRFVVSVAKKFKHFGVPLADLINEGNVGLCTAARKFDGSRGVKFISYAVWWIRQTILVLLAEQGRIARIPVNRAGAMYKIMRAADRLEQELGRPATAAEVAGACGASVEDVEEVLAFSRLPVSFDAATSRPEEPAGSDATVSDRLVAPNQRGTDAVAENRDMRDALARAMTTLTERERRIVMLYYGLEGADSRTLEEISQLEGVTRERVRQIKESAIEKLRVAGVRMGLHEYHGD